MVCRFVAVGLLCSVTSLLEAGESRPVPVGPPKLLQEGEELVYNVRYGFFDLGQVRIRSVHKVETSAYSGYFGKAKIDSYPSVPLVDLHAIYESVFDSAVFSHRFLGKSKEDKDKSWDFSRYCFDYPSHRVYVEMGSGDTIVSGRDTVDVGTEYQDGLSLFFYARKHLTSGATMTIPTFIKEQKVTTIINFRNKRTEVEVDAIEYPVDVVYFDGMAKFVGIFGMSGEFEGWFSNDEARVPILAKMKVLIGSVTIELMEWKRVGWVPPKGAN